MCGNMGVAHQPAFMLIPYISLPYLIAFSKGSIAECINTIYMIRAPCATHMRTIRHSDSENYSEIRRSHRSQNIEQSILLLRLTRVRVSERPGTRLLGLCLSLLFVWFVRGVFDRTVVARSTFSRRSYTPSYIVSSFGFWVLTSVSEYKKMTHQWVDSPRVVSHESICVVGCGITKKILVTIGRILDICISCSRRGLDIRMYRTLYIIIKKNTFDNTVQRW